MSEPWTSGSNCISALKPASHLELFETDFSQSISVLVASIQGHPRSLQAKNPCGPISLCPLTHLWIPRETMKRTSDRAEPWARLSTSCLLWAPASCLALLRFLLMMGVLFCCGAGFFIRRRMYPPPLIEEPAFNVSYTRQPPNPAPGQPAPCFCLSSL